ncbi:iron-sulfur cluster repair di-iron protein [Xanthomarina sp.]|uniref:iron-sulfur cluster repair di-iron protein n=1 Tax=Xanthomarina sp. TaxID=1931211 RepID=UPI002B95F041|nr:iron-sulfur cluster repair di-iron protein [Xanthomarina sp.]HLV39815.1 iron-sulfur cluster repair di-iron protein [Xanthomarina sp.]
MEILVDNILNVTLLEPKHKHPTIFARYDALNEGESLTIHNDHDPKPLYYQLLGERGNVFTWEYLEEGPVWWKVKIRKNICGEIDETLGELAAKDLRKAEVFKKYGLDFSCGGKKTVKEACAEKGLDVTKVEQELQQTDKVPASHPMPYDEWELDFLVDYIVNTHHRYLRKNLPDIAKYANKVMEVHVEQHPELLEINNIVQAVNEEMTAHIAKEEKLLFPYIKELARADKSIPKPKATHFNSIEDIVDNHEKEHETVGNSLNSIKKLTNNYVLPDDACASYTLMYSMLKDFEEDTLLHIHLENNILFPKAIQLEKE